MKKIVLSITILLVSGLAFNSNGASIMHTTAQNSTVIEDNTPVVKAYLVLKDALAADDGVAAKSAAAALKTAVNELSGDSKNLKAVHKEANAIAAAEDIKSQRAALNDLSTHLFALLKEIGASQTLYLAYCPMAKGSWISDEKNITNPYYGKSMLTCGSVKETLEAK